MNSLLKDTYYSALNLLTLGRGIRRTINGVKIIFPTRYYKYYEDNYESGGFKFIEQSVKPGNLVFDIGGHIGLYAVAFGKLVGKSGRVYSFEPTPSTNRILRQTIALNNLDQTVSVQNKAVSAADGETYFYISDDLTDNSNSLVNFEKSRTVKGVKVSLTSVDSFAQQLQAKVDFIKIDTEGAELDALRGARNTMLKDRPICILALHPHQIVSKGDSLAEIWDIISSYDYEVSFNSNPIDKDWFCRQDNLFDVWLRAKSRP
jgi:FkbM family methyltransferase